MIAPNGNKRIGMAKKLRSARKASDNASIGSGSSYGSASSSRSDTSSLSTATSLATIQGATRRPRATAKASLPPPCHLNCTCQQCREPNANFLDGLLNLAPPATSNNSSSSNANAEEDPLSLLIGGMEDFSFWIKQHNKIDASGIVESYLDADKHMAWYIYKWKTE